MVAQEKVPFQDGMLEMLYDSSVLEDLELMREQKENIKRILSELSTKRSKLIHDLNKMSSEGASNAEIEVQKKLVSKLVSEHKASAIQDLSEVILPFQFERLKQSTVQMVAKHMVNSKKVSHGLLAPEIKTYLKIDEQQAKLIEKTAVETRKELNEKIEKLRNEAREKILSKLSAEQRKKYQKLVGDPVAENE
jgi:hypothetical protein